MNNNGNHQKNKAMFPQSNNPFNKSNNNLKKLQITTMNNNPNKLWIKITSN